MQLVKWEDFFAYTLSVSAFQENQRNRNVLSSRVHRWVVTSFDVLEAIGNRSRGGGGRDGSDEIRISGLPSVMLCLS